jgi:type IV secretory pathway VirJ component
MPRSRAGLALILIASLAAAPPALAAAPAFVDGGRYGPVRLARPSGTVRGYVVWFSDRGGWTGTDQDALAAAAGAGALAVGVDLDVYLGKVAATEAACDQLVGDAEGLSRQLQRSDGGAQYAFPILAGRGAGAMVAVATLAQAPVNTLGGAISIDPQPWLGGARPLCAGISAQPQHGGFRYGPPPPMNGFWALGLTPGAGAEVRAYGEQAARAGAVVEQVAVSEAGRSAVLAGLLAPRLAGLGRGPASIAALPLIDLAVAAPSPVMAILLSGDGGWRDLDKTIGEQLQHDGIPVVGWDSVRYFWTHKTPQEMATDLAAVIDAYAARWHADKVALVGYSFGANVLPFAYDLLPEPTRRLVVLVAMLALESRTDWEIQVTGWLGGAPSAAAVPVAPVLAKMPRDLIQCFYGADEKDTLCPALATTGAEVIRTSGGHHFDGDYARLAHRIGDGLRRRAGLAAADDDNNGGAEDHRGKDDKK